ncbi:MAG: ABC transporter permease [Chloroflexi bacterium]|nr:ABC transporter permease [Chloroflexota bacterium]
MMDWKKHLRIVWAIAAKDIVEALRNKNTLMVLVMSLFLVGFYRVMPVLTGADGEPIFLIYDAGDSALTTMLDNSDAVKLYTYPSEEKMKEYLANGNVPELGLIIPADFDQAVADGNLAPLQGYVLAWVDESDAVELVQFAETHIAELLGVSVEIQIAGNTVYLQPDSRGANIMACLGIVFVVIMVGLSLVPHLILEEKQSKTLDALLISPAGSVHVTLAKALAGLFYAIVAVVVAFAVNHNLIVQWQLAIQAAICGSLFTIALGLFLGTFIETRQQLALYSWVLILPLFIPAIVSLVADMLPAWLVSVSQWIPTVALFDLLCVSFSNQTGFELYGARFALLLSSIVLVLTLVSWRMRRLDR